MNAILLTLAVTAMLQQTPPAPDSSAGGRELAHRG